ncbi:flagellar biosynthesis protein FlhB [Paenibacillus thermoaerophilus]|uniref:Flagellar biosynthetic protein FlhB n=1 Tax=Paenibacillus thermoaerophilus TaxID=1215385 RepID=A0ABW2V0T1_9BACL|nr:flagellar biosynthesis protein FlhB [Paenibacillus thermoaerophilus]TMV13809.1 flagellar biosynthesis protein FlhB [Paenibacillus thermoaerophilus]
MPSFRLRLDLQLFSQEKTEPATPKKRQEARKKGQVAKSMEVPSAAILLATLAYLFLFGGHMKERFEKLFTISFREYMFWEATVPNILGIFRQLALEGLLLLMPIFLIALVVGIAANIFQFGWMFTTEPLMLKFSKLNPVTGAKNLFRLQSLVQFLKSLIKLSIIGLIAGVMLWDHRTDLVGLAKLPLEGIFHYAAQMSMELGLYIAVALMILAVLDFYYQKYEFEKSIKMSKQDIKDEHKKTEGDPLIKGKIREKQRRMAIMRMMQDVPKADVVITNPTHFAVAIAYDASSMDAPKVLAKGVDYIALRIRGVAAEHGVTIMENKPLARALYQQTEIGQTIPPELFQAVAEVLAYVYKLKNKAQ